MASIIQDLLSRVQSLQERLQDGTLVRGVLEMHEADILDLQRRQLLSGLDSSGNDMRPYYSEDLKPGGYFKSSESAGRYAAWKQSLSYPYEANRNPDAPNLYIDGTFHSELVCEFGPESVSVTGSTGKSMRIIAKYGLRKFGLTLANWGELFAGRGVYAEMLEECKSVIYG